MLLAGLSLGVLAFLDRRSVDALASDFIVMQGDDVVLESDALPPLYAGSWPLPLSKILAGLRPLPEPRPAHEGDALADALLRSDLMESILPGASLDSFDTYLTRLESGNCLLCGMEGAGGHPSRSAFSGGGAGFMVLGGGLGGGGGDQGAPGTDDSLAPGGFADAAGGPATPGETDGRGTSWSNAPAAPPMIWSPPRPLESRVTVASVPG